MNNFISFQCGLGSYYFLGSNFIKSSILKIVIAASVANLIDFILEIMGYKIPAFKLFFGFPFIKSNPQYLS